jgi:hypothetical protein
MPPGQVDELVRVLYADLRQVAAHHLQAERRDHTLQPTALGSSH